MNTHKKLERAISSTDSGGLSSGGESFDGDTDKEGYDLEFVPSADPRFECPICLLILRNPVQTECGHRFCKACILQWFRKSSESQCPVDKMVLSEKQLFPDNFAKREINTLNVKCRNHSKGCPAVVQLKSHDYHLKECEFELEPCPNRCSGIFYRKELEHHLQESCPKRTVKCPHCFKEENYEFMQNHLDLCPRRGIKCKFCSQQMLRQEMDSHLATSCTHIPVRCMFSPLGCNVTIARHLMTSHMNDTLHEHMRLLAASVASLLKMVHPSHSFTEASRGVSDYESGAMATGPAELPSTGSVDTTSGYFSMRNTEGVTSVAVPLSRGYSTALTMSQNYDSIPSSAASQILANLNKTTTNLEHLHLLEPNIRSRVSRTSSGDPIRTKDSDLIDALSSKVHQQEEKLSRLSIELAECKGKTKSMRDTIEMQNKFIKKLEAQLSDVTARTFNGTYVWRIENYSTKRHEAITGKNPVLHSPSFYSSPYGYKLCIRVNLNGVDSAAGTHISLFIHFLRGDYDDILDWPFSGHITMGILDQHESCQARKPISESFEANPSFAAFQRPTSSRNHKGFGYMEFVPTEIIEKGSYIYNDTLVIRVKIDEH